MPPPRHGRVLVVDVWAHNQEEELAHISDPEVARRYPIAAVAAFHDDGPPGGQGYPDTLEGRYEAIRGSVERATSAQVGLALATHDGELALGGRVWRFHLGAGAGMADPRRVCAGIRAHANATVPRGAMVTSDGAWDVAYLFRDIAADGALPRSRAEFLRLCGVWFPSLYDLRVLAEWTRPSGHPPPLAAAVDGGSCAFRAFLALRQDAWFWDVRVAYNGFLYGLGAADNEYLVLRKILKAEEEERERLLKELLPTSSQTWLPLNHHSFL